MISNKFISDAVNAKVAAGSLTDLELTQLTGTVASLKSAIVTVNTIADLPNVVDNLGRMIYVIAEENYYFSDGVDWGIDYSTTYSTSSAEYSWGGNFQGQLGDGTTTSRLSPVTIVGDSLVWASLTANKSSQGLSFGITTDGVAYAWGGDQNGAQGTGSSFVSKSSPVTVAGGLTWSQIAAYPFGGVGITTDGVAYGWGQNTSGIIGCGDANARNSPVSVVGGLTFSQLSVGYAHTVAITSSGVAWSWGRNSQGQLGIGSSSYGTSRLSPVSVVGGLTFTQVTAGYNFCCGIANTGVAYSWGYQTSGRLGDGGSGYTAVVSPKSVVGGLTWSQVSAGTQHCLGLRTNGVAYGWGTNTKAELGDGTLSNRSSPVSVLGGITNWSQLSAGKEHSLGATSAGILYAWGNNDNGQMGTGNLTSSRSPVTVIGGLSGWVKLSAGGGHNLAILTVESGIE